MDVVCISTDDELTVFSQQEFESISVILDDINQLKLKEVTLIIDTQEDIRNCNTQVGSESIDECLLQLQEDWDEKFAEILDQIIALNQSGLQMFETSRANYQDLNERNREVVEQTHANIVGQQTTCLLVCNTY